MGIAVPRLFAVNYKITEVYLSRYLRKSRTKIGYVCPIKTRSGEVNERTVKNYVTVIFFKLCSVAIEQKFQDTFKEMQKIIQERKRREKKNKAGWQLSGQFSICYCKKLLKLFPKKTDVMFKFSVQNVNKYFWA